MAATAHGEKLVALMRCPDEVLATVLGLCGRHDLVPTSSIMLITQHLIDTATDADAYLARLDAFAGLLDDETERFRRDTGAAVCPPDFILDTVLVQLGLARATPQADASSRASSMIQSRSWRKPGLSR